MRSPEPPQHVDASQWGTPLQAYLVRLCPGEEDRCIMVVPHTELDSWWKQSADSMFNDLANTNFKNIQTSDQDDITEMDVAWPSEVVQPLRQDGLVVRVHSREKNLEAFASGSNYRNQKQASKVALALDSVLTGAVLEQDGRAAPQGSPHHPKVMKRMKPWTDALCKVTLMWETPDGVHPYAFTDVLREHGQDMTADLIEELDRESKGAGAVGQPRMRSASHTSHTPRPASSASVGRGEAPQASRQHLSGSACSAYQLI